MAVTYLRTPSVPKNMQAIRTDGNPLGKGSVIGREAQPIAVMHQDADGSFKPMPSVVTAVAVEPTVTEALPPDAGESRAKPEYQVAVDHSPAQAAGLAVPAPANPSSSPIPAMSSYAPVQPTAPPKRVRVRMSNKGMGRVTVSVRAVSVSESCIILAYPKDADNIVEPPICGGDNPIQVDYEGSSFTCVFGGWTAELENMFLVILLLTDPEDKPT